MDADKQISSVKALGQVESIKDEIERIELALESVPLWRPASALKKQCGEVSRMIDDLRERFEKKLVVTLVGPSGSGKSTLLNALAGTDDLSEAGTRRPTTRHLVVLSAAREDAEQLRREIGGENVDVQTERVPASIENIMLVDTPDTDSTGSRDYNQQLSEKRAMSVASYLKSRNIVDARFEIVGFGEDYPIADNSTAEGRAQNRRVELTLIPITEEDA